MSRLTGKKDKRKEISQKNTKRQARRRNAQLYPIYKMFSWDLLCFYAIQFLFYTITKGITASQVLVASALYLLFKILMEIPAVTVADAFGHRKSLIMGNFLLFLSMVALIWVPGFGGVILFNFLYACGYDIKSISETNLLYTSVSTRGGEGLYSKIDSRGASWYYFLDGILCLAAGYLFMKNNYIPVYICTAFTLIATALSFQFRDVNKKKTENLKIVMKDYSSNLKNSVRFIIKSNRMKAYILFGAVFYGIIKVMDTYASDILIENGLLEEQYSTIFAIATLISGIVVTYSRKIHKKFKNKTLSFLSLTYIAACLIVGTVAVVCTSDIAIPIMVIMFFVFKSGSALWYVLGYKYLKNFTTEEIRNKIMFTYELITSLGASVISFLGSILLNFVNINYAFLLMSLVFCIAIVLILDFMRTRVGLRPKDYKKEDIEFKI